MSNHWERARALALAAAVLSGCGDEGGGGNDAGSDAGSDAGHDAGSDAGHDAGPTVAFTSGPTIALVGATAGAATLEVFARGDDDRVYRRARVSGAWGDWTDEFDASGFSGDLDVASWADGRLDLAARGSCAGSNGVVCQGFRTTSYSPYFELTSGQAGLTDPPTIASAMDGRLFLASPTIDGGGYALSFRYWNGGAWSPWVTSEDFPTTSTTYDSVGYLDTLCVFMGGCTNFENYYVTSATDAGRVMVGRLVALAGSFVGSGVDVTPEVPSVPLFDASLSVYDEGGGARLALYAKAAAASGQPTAVYRLAGTPLAVDHAPGDPGTYDFEETNVTWATEWTAMPTPPVRLTGALDCLSSNLRPSFETCAARGEDGAIWLLERGDASPAWRSLERP